MGVVVELTMKLYDVSGLYAGSLTALDDQNGTSFKYGSVDLPYPILPCCALLHDSEHAYSSCGAEIVSSRGHFCSTRK